MTVISFFQVDAFASRPLTGNPAAVMPLDHWLGDELLQAIAAENNLSETAFAVPSTDDKADYQLRWFTPTTEVDLCGHATLATAHILLNEGCIRFATRSGVLRVERDGEALRLDLPASRVEPAEAPGLHAALRLNGGEVYRGTGGNGALIVLLGSEAEVRAVAPDFAALKAYDSLVIVTAPGDREDVASRVFAVYHGIDEDPVTGSAHAALVPFWAHRLGRGKFRALQASARGGLLDCRLDGERVILGGRCFTVIEGSFQL